MAERVNYGGSAMANMGAEDYYEKVLVGSRCRHPGRKQSPLFRTVDNRRKITGNPMTRTDVLRMAKRRARDAGLPSTSCHTFRATGITAYLENGGTIENAQLIAAHA
jgi:integrase/recombinase XerD